QRAHYILIGFHSRARGNTKKPCFRIDGAQVSVFADLHPRDVVSNGPDAIPLVLERRHHHGQIRFPARTRKRRAHVSHFAARRFQPQDQHVIGHLAGPIMYGTTYIARPRIAPSSSAPTLCFAAFGSIQLFVGPASSFWAEQIKVRCSVRATSFGLLRCKWQFGKVFSLSVSESPWRSISAIICWYSASEPSQYTTRSGFVSLAA